MARIGRRLVSTAATQPPGIGPSNGTYKLLAVLEDHAVASPTCCLPSHSASHPCASFTRLAACPLCPCEQQLTCTTAQMCSAWTGGRRYSTQTWSGAAGRQRVCHTLICCTCRSQLLLLRQCPAFILQAQHCPANSAVHRHRQGPRIAICRHVLGKAEGQAV
jgi:hypothetical protein